MLDPATEVSWGAQHDASADAAQHDHFGFGADLAGIMCHTTVRWLHKNHNWADMPMTVHT